MAQGERAPIRVLYIDHTAKISGGEIALCNLIQHLDRRVVSPVVLLFENGPLVERLKGIAETHILSVDEAVLETRKDGLGWSSVLRVREVWSVLRHVTRVARFARKQRPDLIHTNSLKADIIGGLAGRLEGIPVIWHVRDRIESDYLPMPVVRVFRALCRVIPKFVIANSTATLATTHLGPKQRGAAIASGIVARNYVPRSEADEMSRRSGGARVGLIGRISPWKGQEIFIQAAGLLHADFPDVVFEIIGAPLFSEKEFEAGLHALCDRLNLTDSVHFVGFVDDVPGRIAQLDIVVHASTVAEPFGQVIVEGMAAQKPVVATDGGGVPEIVEDGVTGLLVPMGDIGRMAEAIRYLLEHPAEAAEMGRRGREHATTRFGISRTVQQVQGVYESVLSGSAA